MAMMFQLAPGAGNQPPAVANYFLRSDTPDGLARQPGSDARMTPPPDAIQGLLQGLASGQIIPTGPEGLAYAQTFGYSPPGPTDPNYIGDQLAGGQNPLDLLFGPIPGTPANTQPTIQMRELLQRAIEAEHQYKIAQQNADLAAELGRSADALAWKQQADQLALRTRELDQQASQFSQTFGLQQEETRFRQELDKQRLALDAEVQRRQLDLQQGRLDIDTELGRGDLALRQRQQGFEEDKYTTTLASNPMNLIESAVWQSGRMPGGMQPNATSFGGNANTATARNAGMGQQGAAPVGINEALGSQYSAMSKTGTGSNAPIEYAVGGPAVGPGDPGWQGQAPSGGGGYRYRPYGSGGGEMDPSAPVNTYYDPKLNQPAPAPGGNIESDFGKNYYMPPKGGYADPKLNATVPISATTNALLTGSRVPRFGMTRATGRTLTLGELQQNPNLRLNYSNMDAVSLRNVLGNQQDAAFLDSIARAQGQSASTFANALGYAVPRGRSMIRRGF